MMEWTQGRNFSHLRCQQWRDLAMKKVAVWASQLTAYRRARELKLALVIEDDVVFVPNLALFSNKLNTLLRYMAANVTMTNEADVVFLGSCLEELELVDRCTPLPNRTFLSKGVAPNCAHGLLLTNNGLAKFIYHLKDWGSEFIERSLHTKSPRNCSLAPHIQAAGREGVQAVIRGQRMKQFWKLYDGQDAVIRDRIKDGGVSAYHIWPQLIMQRGRWSDQAFSYRGRKPQACDQVDDVYLGL